MAGVWDSVAAAVSAVAPLVLTPFDGALQWVEGRDVTRGISSCTSGHLYGEDRLWAVTKKHRRKVAKTELVLRLPSRSAKGGPIGCPQRGFGGL